MLETEWFSRYNLELKLKSKVTEIRKMNLFACAIANRLKPFLTEEEEFSFLKTQEEYADEGLSPGIFQQKLTELNNLFLKNKKIIDFLLHKTNKISGSSDFSVLKEIVQELTKHGKNVFVEADIQYDIFFDIFGNPYLEFSFNKTQEISDLAKTMYDNNDFSWMPVLEQKLIEIQAPIYITSHCRKTFHTKGCYVIDYILGKK